ncbi:MAG TPA: HEPN domain-containing protein [Pyrinomonadaceae bacterium]|jgi:hypothetical protein|nr:HEPN domain-containing protein [Pyrinomonadaceae bacterium]
MTSKSSASQSIEFIHFNLGLIDAHLLRALYDEEMKENLTIAKRYLDVLKRAGIIVGITAWETYIEDKIKSQFEKNIEQAVSPKDIQSAFNSVAEEWLSAKPKPPDLATWASEGWKVLIREKFTKDIESLNTPSSEHIRKLTKRYLNLDLTQKWRWPGVTYEEACRKLDSLIKLRGGIVHRGRSIAEKKRIITKRQLLASLGLIQRLAVCTENALKAKV